MTTPYLVCDRCGTPIKNVFRYQGSIYGSECIFKIAEESKTPRLKKLCRQHKKGANLDNYFPVVGKRYRKGGYLHAPELTVLAILDEYQVLVRSKVPGWNDLTSEHTISVDAFASFQIIE